MQSPVFSWIFEHQMERGKQWYMIAATLVITVIVTSFLLSAYLLGIVCILFVGVYLLYEVNTHPFVHVEIGETGIAINGDEYSYSSLRSFGLISLGDQMTILRYTTQSQIMKSIDVYVDPEVPIDTLRSFLVQYIPEDTSLRIGLMERILMVLKL